MKFPLHGVEKDFCQPSPIVLEQLNEGAIILAPFEGDRDGQELVYLVNDNYDLLMPLAKKDALHYYASFDHFLKELKDMKKYEVYKDHTDTRDLFIKVLRSTCDNALIGFVSYFFNGVQAGEINLMVIKEKYQGKGYGKLLLHDAITQITGAGAQKIYLNVLKENNAAKSLYKSCGFEIDPLSCPDNNPIRMSKTIKN
jgi:ribosomal protein S18 acetylase RimI-like enzyme